MFVQKKSSAFFLLFRLPISSSLTLNDMVHVFLFLQRDFFFVRRYRKPRFRTSSSSASPSGVQMASCLVFSLWCRENVQAVLVKSNVMSFFFQCYVNCAFVPFEDWTC